MITVDVQIRLTFYEEICIASVVTKILNYKTFKTVLVFKTKTTKTHTMLNTKMEAV